MADQTITGMRPVEGFDPTAGSRDFTIELVRDFVDDPIEVSELFDGTAQTFGDASQQTAISDTFCLTSKKRSWSIHDTPESIADARRWNYLVDRRCGVPGRDSA